MYFSSDSDRNVGKDGYLVRVLFPYRRNSVDEAFRESITSTSHLLATRI